jgi:multiple sugar transport system substrate-binding protein
MTARLSVCLLWLIIFAAGCGQRDESAATPESPAKKAITLVHGSGVAFEKALDEIIDAFHQTHPDIQVTRMGIPGGSYYRKLETMIAGGTVPDVMWMGKGFVNFVSRDAFLDINPYIAKEPAIDVSQYFQQVVDLYRYKGGLYGMPYGFQTDVLYYNKDMFDDAGLPYPDLTWNWDKMVEIAKKLTRDTDGDERTDQFGLGGYYWALLIIRQGGGDVLDEETETKCLLREQAAIDAMRFIGDLKNKHKVTPTIPLSEYGTGEDELFKMGKLGMYHSARWLVNGLREADFEWDIALQPKGPTGVRCGWVSCDGYTVAKRTKHPDAAVKLLKHIVGKASQMRLAKLYATPSLNSVVESEFYKEQVPASHAHVFVDALEFARPDLRHRHSLEIMAKVGLEADNVLIGKKTAEEACAAAAKEVEKILAGSAGKD